ncbi:MAG: hypothetical protein KBE25_03760 [Laribacter sp.]|nr:hypothetical protein [Laribacter sp.]MBP9526916.1 hypothetical protein [Laribacter sp.]MBP9608449.1 hypothetical protein [Laribacter sp.]
MPTLTPSPNPALTTSLPALTTNSVAHPDTWNPTHQTLLDNDVHLATAISDLSDSLGSQVGDLGRRVAGVEATSPVAVQNAVGLDWLYRGNRVAFELFTAGYTLIDFTPVPVISGVAADDSIDVADTSAIRAGEYYVLTDAAGSALVQVASVLSSTRVRLSANLARSWDATARITRNSLTVTSPGRARGEAGAIWLSRVVNIGTDLEGGAVVIRRSLNAADTRLYYRDAWQTTWKECGWSYRRQGGDIPAGFADYEYSLPMRGDGWLRMDVATEAVDLRHLVVIGAATGLGGYLNPVNRPNAPAISSPANAATGLMERPTLSLAGYTSPPGVAQAGVQFQLATANAFATVLHDSGEQPAGLSYTVPAGVLATNTTCYLRGRVKDAAGLWSDWSTVTSFTTAASFAYVAAPVITGPANNAVDVPEQPTLSSSAFAVVGGADTHAASQWQVRAAAGTWATPLWDSGTDATNKTSVVVPAGKLLAGQGTYYVRVRHQGTGKGWSEWGAESKFVTKQAFANVIGIVLAATGGGSGTWKRVDENGADKVTDAAFFNAHATYGGISGVTIDGQAMIRIPAFHVKTGTVASGAYAGKRAWWISDQPLAGYALHPAFMDAGSPINQFYVGKYQGTNDGGTRLGSVAGATPLVNIDFPTMQARANARNTGGVTGFGLWNYYQLAAIQLLALIEMGGADSQTLIGQGNVSGSAALATDHATVAQASWRGIVGLWGNVWQMVDGLQTDGSSKYRIWDKNGNKTYQTTGQTAPANGTYPVTFSTDSGASHDLSIGFVPATGDRSISNSSTGDYFYQDANCGAYHGGYWGDSVRGGLFCLYVNCPLQYSAPHVGGRLAKV